MKPEHPTMTYLIEQVRARCAQKGLPLPDRRTIKARVDRIDRRIVALKRKDARGIRATKATPGQYVASRPLEIVQIDHTEVGVFLVDETTRQPMDKRPWLTLAIDVFTRMVVDFHLSMDEPSRVSLGLCMLNAVYDKNAWLKEREIDASWPAAGLPDAVHADNGADFRSHALAWACREEGIKLIFRPVGAPHYGGHIERLIGAALGRALCDRDRLSLGFSRPAQKSELLKRVTTENPRFDLAQFPPVSFDHGFPLAYKHFYVYVQDERVSKLALENGAIAAGVVFALFVALAVFLYANRKSTLHGDARFGTFSEARRAGLAAENGIILGRLNGQTLVSNDPGHVLIVGPTRTGKGLEDRGQCRLWLSDGDRAAKYLPARRDLRQGDARDARRRRGAQALRRDQRQ
ncbi:MAG: hypothetical protein EKK29_11025 [Hyphomicrobiales bacterium]|nr:MAG: hypothetical protein EKK29_11025 [Hyphomicrobiales bacterium]